jgi:hypothetical protein
MKSFMQFAQDYEDNYRELSASSLARLASAQPAHPGSSPKGIELNGVLSSAYKFAAGEVSSSI